MLNYNKFLLIEKKEKKTIFLSDKFIDILLNFDDNIISNRILNEFETNYLYVDVTKYNNYISYINQNDITNTKHTIKIGKFINRLYPNQYTPSEIEIFVNLYKSVIDYNNVVFKIYKGDDIKKWYNYENLESTSTLGSSCMRYSRCSDYLDIYTNNPEKISLLVLFDKNNLNIGIGRSIIWDIDIETKMLDNIYISKEHYKDIFKKYAKINNIKLNIEYNKEKIKIHTYLKPIKYNNYPYMDTLFMYQPHNGIITNNNDKIEVNKQTYILDDVYGSYRTWIKR